MAIPPPISFTGISRFSENFQTILERAFTVANLPVKNLQTDQTIILSQQTELAAVEDDVQGLQSVLSQLGVLAAQGASTADSTDTGVATIQLTGAPDPVDFDIAVTSAAAAAQETTVTGLADADTTAPSADGVYNLTLGTTTTAIDLLTIGSGRTAGTTGSTTPSPKVGVQVDFSNGLSGSISAELESFFVATTAVSGASAGDTVSVRFESADGLIDETITTAALGAGASVTDVASALDAAIAGNANLTGKISFSDEGGSLKATVSDTAGTSFDFTSSSTGTIVSGLEGGGSAGGHSAEEIAAALNAQVALDSSLSAAGVRFSAVGGEVRIEGDKAFDAAVTDLSRGTGFASGLAGTQSIAGYDNTLDGLRDYINAHTLGVHATVINTSSDVENPEYRLTLTATKTGDTTLTLEDSGSNNLITTSNQGTNAVFTVNGVAVENSQNTIADFAPGISLTIVGAGTTTVDVGEDRAGVSQALSDFASAYNAVQARLRAHIGLSAGVLSGNAIIREGQSALRQITGHRGTGSVRSIAELGLKFDEDGQLQYDSATFLTRAASDFAGIIDFVGDTTSGFAGEGSSRTRDLADPVTGQIRTAINFLKGSDETLQAQIDKALERIDRQIANLEAQFSAADTLLAKLESQQNLLTKLFEKQNNGG